MVNQPIALREPWKLCNHWPTAVLKMSINNKRSWTQELSRAIGEREREIPRSMERIKLISKTTKLRKSQRFLYRKDMSPLTQGLNSVCDCHVATCMSRWTRTKSIVECTQQHFGPRRAVRSFSIWIESVKRSSVHLLPSDELSIKRRGPRCCFGP